MNIIFRCVVVGLCVWALTAPAPAQPAESGVTIRTTVREVALDVLVRDARGRPVRDLKRGEVDIYEDGVRQEVRGFRLVPGREVRERGRTPDNAKTTVAAAQRFRAMNVICLVFHNIPADTNILKYMLQAAQEFLAQPLQPDTYVGVFRLDSRLVPLHPFSADRGALTAAARNGFMAAPVEFARAAAPVLEADPRAAGGSPEPAGQPAAGEPRGIVGALATSGSGAAAMRGVAVGARQHMDQLNAMVEQLGGLPGRKTILLFSSGVVNPEEPGLLDAVIGKAQRARISVYAIDPLGPSELDSKALASVAERSRRQQQVNPDPRTALENMRQTEDLQAAVRSTNMQAALRALAEGTGGSLYATYDLKRPFERVLEDLDTHYEVTYRPSAQKLDGHLRAIEVRLARAGLSAETRAGYFAVPDAGDASNAFETAALAALAAEPRPRAFDFHSAGFQFRSEAAGSECAIAFQVPAANLAATPDPDSMTHRLHVSLLALVKDSEGRVVAKLGRDFPAQVPNDRLAALRADALTYTRPLKLAAGRYTLETAAVDREGMRSSTNVTPLEIRAPRKGIGLSSVVLVQRVEPAGAPADASDPLVDQGQRVVPLLAPNLSPDAKPSVYFVVYPDKSNPEPAKIQVEFLAGGEVLAKQAADLPPAGASGAIPMTIAAATRPGDCELRITASQGSDSVTGSVRYTRPLQ